MRAITAGFLPEGPKPKEFETEDCKRLSRELGRLGFAWLGVKYEKSATNEVSELCFASHQHRAFAGIFTLKNGTPKLFFTTPFTNGAAVLTGMYARREQRGEWQWASGVDTNEPELVLQRHLKKTVEYEKREGFEVYAEWNQAARLRATREWYEKEGA